MSPYRTNLPQLAAPLFLTDGGIETSLIFEEGIDLPDFAAFVLLDHEAGRAALERYFAAYLAIARRDGVGIVLETPTWRASADWAARLGYSVEGIAEINREAVAFLGGLREQALAPARVWRAAFAGVVATDLHPELGRITVPVRLIWGDDDGLIPGEEQDRLRAALPAAELVVYRGAGHSPNWEEPARVAADIVQVVHQVSSMESAARTR